MTYRQDINGLRAIAVVAVVLFHFNSTWLSGGFAGVDVFFVISGFLMTGIVYRGIESHNFSILGFYMSRANRIVPALSVLCLVLLILGWIYLTVYDYRLLGKHVASSMGFISNIIYESESGYFNSAAKDKWLLHTWSLSVEWQFYMLYPIILITLNRFFSIKTIGYFLLAGTVVGYIYSVFSSLYGWPGAFYGLSSRAWEMLLGGVAYAFPSVVKNLRRNFVEKIGLALILSSYFFLSEHDLWPGYLAILPALGTYLVIIAYCQNSIITGNVVFQKIGSASYSIYLWHWPVVVVMNYFDLSGILNIFWGIIISMLLGFISYSVIEKNIKFNRFKFNKLKVFIYPPVLLVMFVGAFGASIYIKNGVVSRLNSPLLLVERSPKSHTCDKINCSYFYDNTEWAVIGDSHSKEIAYVLAKKIKNTHKGVKEFSYSGCAPTYKRDIKINCAEWTNQSVLELIDSEEIKNVIISYRYSGYLFGSDTDIYPALPNKAPVASEGLSNEISRAKILQSVVDMVNDLSNAKDKVYVVLPIPELKENVNKSAFKLNFFEHETGDQVGSTLNYYMTRNELVRSTLLSESYPDNVIFIDPMKLFCNDDACFSILAGVPLYFDDNHLSMYGADKLLNTVL